MSVWEWADANRHLGADSPERGNYRTDRTPYARQIMDCLSPFHPARHIAWEKGVQIGATTVGLNWIGFIASQNPAPTIITLPSEGVAKEWSHQRLTQLVEETPCLQSKLVDAKRKGSGSVYLKRIAGTTVTIKIAWSSSAKKLRSTPAANLLSDEVDGFENDPDGEGSVLVLLDGRFVNFPRGKHFMISTPTREPSKIHAEFLKGDQRHYFIPCPFCGRFQSLDDPNHKRGFRSLKWSDGFLGFECVSCGQRFAERFKTQFLSRGMWVATREAPELLRDGFDDPRHLASIISRMEREKFASFHSSAMYSPIGWYSWDTLREDWQKAQHSANDLKAVINTKLAEVWEERGDVPDDEKIWARREHYHHFSQGIGKLPWNSEAMVPRRGLILTAAVDIQQNPPRIEVGVKAWGRGKEAWHVGYWVFYGDVSRIENEPWQLLDELLAKDFRREDGAMLSIMAMGIDTGYLANVVYEFALKHPQPWHSDATGSRVVEMRTVIPTGGDPHDWQKIVSSVSKTDAARKRQNVRIWKVGGCAAKGELYGWLRLPIPEGDTPSPGFQHYPDYQRAWFTGLCSEQRKVAGNGRPYYEIIPGHERNEPLDTEQYNRLVAAVCGIDRFTDDEWGQLESRPEDEAAETAQSSVRDDRSEHDGRRDWFGRKDWF
jgi:phage terminase large subunit GpA-like protein